jgi:hypothetical protein
MEQYIQSRSFDPHPSLQQHLNVLENDHCRAEVVPVVNLLRNRHSIYHHHGCRPLGAQSIKEDFARTAIDVDHVSLAALRVQASLTVVVEERVKSSAVNQYIYRVDHPQTP